MKRKWDTNLQIVSPRLQALAIIQAEKKETKKGAEGIKSTSKKNKKPFKKAAKKKIKAVVQKKTTELLLSVPDECEYNISLAGYQRNVEKNLQRQEKGIGAAEAIQRDFDSISSETRKKRLEYNDILLGHVCRLIWAKNRDTSTSNTCLIRRRSDSAIGFSSSIPSSNLNEANEGSLCEDEDVDNHEETDALSSNSSSIDKTENCIESPRFSLDELKKKWSQFCSNGFFVGKHLDFFDLDVRQGGKFKGWYAARIDQILDTEKRKYENVLDEWSENFPFYFVIRCFGYKANTAETVSFTKKQLALAELIKNMDSLCIWPPNTHCFANGKGYPTRKERRNWKRMGNTITSEQERNEIMRDDSRPWTDGAGLSLENVLFGKRRRTQRSSYEPSSAEKEADELLRNSGTVCGICGEESYERDPDSEVPLIICEGGCCNVYHAPCLGLAGIPVGKFVCDLCVNKSHECFACDGFEEDEETVQCKFSGCGKYYHPTCVRKTGDCAQIFSDPIFEAVENVECNRGDLTTKKKQKMDVGVDSALDSTFANTVDSSTEAVSTPTQSIDQPKELNFFCPAHTCLSCISAFPDDLSRARSGFVKRCLNCEAGYHSKCLPYGALSNDLGFLCNECAREYDPPLSRIGRTEFSDQNSRRLACDLEIDYSRKFQIDALDISYEKVGSMKLDPALLADLNSEKPKKPQKRLKIPAYQKIAVNWYSKGCKPIVEKSTIEETCVCEGEHGCSETCLNVGLKIECFAQGSTNSSNCGTYCPFTRLLNCGNQRFQKQQYKECKIIETPGRGHGLQLEEDALKGDFIIEYVGEIISKDESMRRLLKMSTSSDPHVFQMALNSEQVIDAKLKGNLARFINHSCEPNCVLHKWNVCGVDRVGIFAKRDIAAEEELSFDYSFDKSTQLEFSCLCGAPLCRGTLETVTRKETEAMRKTAEVARNIESIKREASKARRDVLPQKTLLKRVKSELELLSEFTEEDKKRQRLSARKFQRKRTAKSLLAFHDQTQKDLNKNLDRALFIRDSAKDLCEMGSAGIYSAKRTPKILRDLSYSNQKPKSSLAIPDPFRIARERKIFLVRNLRAVLE